MSRSVSRDGSVAVQLSVSSSELLEFHESGKDFLCNFRSNDDAICSLARSPSISEDETLRVKYLPAGWYNQMVEVWHIYPDGSEVEIYRGSRKGINVWIFVAIFVAWLCFQSLGRKEKNAPKAPDKSAKRFYPNDEPGAHWTFVETEAGTRFAKEEEKEEMKKNA